MPIYEYEALTSSGKKKKGVIDADDGRSARSRLRAEGIHVTDVKEITKKKEGPKLSLRRKKIDAMELAMITRQLATLMESDIPLREAIGALIDQVDNRNLQLVFRDIREKITTGIPFAEAISEHSWVFSDLYVNMVRAGEAAGNMDPVLNRLADYLQAQSRMKGKVTAALAYPVVMMFIGAAVVIFLVTFVVPKLQGVFDAREGAELPMATQILVGSSNFIINNWVILLAAFLSIVFSFLWAIKQTWGRRAYDLVCLKLPVLGTLFKKQAVSRFSVTFATLLKSGLPAMEALRIVRNIVNNVLMAETLDEVQKSVLEGGDMATPIRKSKVFPSAVGYMVSVGEQSGHLDEVLQRIAIAYDEEVDIATQKFTALLEPIMIVSLSVIVGFIVLAIIQPIMEMGQL